MTKALTALLMCLAVYCPAYAHDPMTTEDMLLEGAMVGLLVLDLGQSRGFSRQLEDNGARKYHEINPIMGQNPSDVQLRNVVLGTMVGHALITYLLPSDIRTRWLYGTVGLELSVVGNNARIGMKVNY